MEDVGYRSFFENAAHGLFRATPDGRLIMLNPAMARIMGYDSPQEALEHSVELGARAHRESGWNRELAERLSSQGRVDAAEVVLEKTDGGTIFVELDLLVVKDAEGRSLHIDGRCADVTEQRRSAEAIRQGVERSRHIAENLPGLVYEFYAIPDGSYGFTYTTDRLREIFGIAPGLDSLFPTFVAHVHTEDREPFLESIRRAVAECAVWDFEGRFVKPSGEVMWFHGRSTPTRQVDRILFHGLVLDVTERRVAEERFRQVEEKYHTVFMTSPECIAITRMKDGCILEVNQGFEDITGWDRHVGIGKTSLAIGFWVDPSERERMVRDLGAGMEIANRAFRFRRRDGVARDGIYSARAIRIADEDCLIFVLQDVTERVRLEEDRQKLEQQLLQSQKMDAIGQLAGGVAHDFNNMLSVIIGNAEMALQQADISQPANDALREILYAGERSAELTQRLLTFARKQTIDPKVLDLNEKVAGMSKMLRRLIGENIELTLASGTDLWRVRIDPGQVDQLLANLVVNARDAIAGAGRIAIETANVSFDGTRTAGPPGLLPGDYVMLSVSDNGCGMSREIQASIFEPFFTTKKEGHGTGLGLATVYGIVRQNSGVIVVESEPDAGSTFRIYLPRTVSVAERREEVRESHGMPGGRETILIVEDEAAVLRLGRTMLEKLGYRVLAAGKAEQAMLAAREHEGGIDLLLTDVVMPDMNGKDLMERIRAIRPGIRCLFMSGYTADVISRQGVLEDGVHFISKPFTLKDLSLKIRRTLEQSPSNGSSPTAPRSTSS